MFEWRVWNWQISCTVGKGNGREYDANTIIMTFVAAIFFCSVYTFIMRQVIVDNVAKTILERMSTATMCAFKYLAGLALMRHTRIGVHSSIYNVEWQMTWKTPSAFCRLFAFVCTFSDAVFSIRFNYVCSVPVLHTVFLIHFQLRSHDTHGKKHSIVSGTMIFCGPRQIWNGHWVRHWKYRCIEMTRSCWAMHSTWRLAFWT